MKEIIYRILDLRRSRKIPFERTFSFVYEGDGRYYINKTRYNVKRVKDDFWIKIDNPILSETSTLNPSNIKVSVKESAGGNFLDVEFYAAMPQKIIELAFELFAISFCVFSLVNMKWIFAGLAFLMFIFPLVVFRLEKMAETRNVMTDLKTICD